MQSHPIIGIPDFPSNRKFPNCPITTARRVDQNLIKVKFLVFGIGRDVVPGQTRELLPRVIGDQHRTGIDSLDLVG